jgi:O-antigen ligase
VPRTGARLLAALAPAALLVVDPWGWYPFGPVRWLLISTLALAGPAVAIHGGALRRPPRGLGLAVAAFVGWLLVAGWFADDPLYAWMGTPERHLGVLTWLLCALLMLTGFALVGDGDGDRVATVVDGLLVAGLGVGAVATAEALGWEPSVLDVASRLSGPLGSPAYLGAATALLLPVAVALAVPHAADGSRVRVWAARAAVVVLVVACLGSGARAAWVGLAAAAAVAAAAHAPALWRALRARPGRAAVGGAFVLAAAVVVLVATPVGARLGAATDPDAAGGRGRLDEWRVAARVVADHPVVGVGPEGYRTAFHEAVDARYERTHGRDQQPDRAHSAPLDLALDGGVPLALAWLAVVTVVGRSCWRALRQGPYWAQGVAAGLVAHVVGQLLLFPIAELEPVAWLLAGIVVAATPRPTGSGQDVRGGRGLATALGALAIVAALAGVTDVVADHRAERAVEALHRGDTRAAATAADAAADLRPDEVRLHLLASRAAVADGRGAQAGLERVDDALRVSPRDPIARLEHTALLVQRAEATQTPEHLAAARRELDRRLRDDPFAAALWRLDARLANVEGDSATAARATRRADALTPPAERARGS